MSADPLDFILAGLPALDGSATLAERISAQVSELCGDIKRTTASKLTPIKRHYLQKLGAELSRDASRTRKQRHRMISAEEITGKYQAETGFTLLGTMAEPPLEQWDLPQAQTLYWKLCVRPAGTPSIADYEGDDLKYLTWMAENELLDIDGGDGTIWLLSDCEDTSRSYPGAPVGDDRAILGGTWAADVVDGMVAYAFDRLEAGNPLAPLSAGQVREMDCPAGMRFSAREAARQVNAGILAPDRDARCRCTGRDEVEHAWDLRDHDDPECPCRRRWVHVESARRSIARLKEADGPLNCTQNTYLTRRGHTEYRVAAAFEIAPDAGWHVLAFESQTRETAKPGIRRRSGHSLRKARHQLERAR